MMLSRLIMASLLLFSASAFARAPSIEIKESYTVSSSKILLGDVARLRGFSTAGRARLAKVELAKAPRIGQPKVLRRSFLKTQISSQVGPGVRLKLPKNLRVTRASRTVESTELARRFEVQIRKMMGHHPDDVASVRVSRMRPLQMAKGGKVRFLFSDSERFEGRLNARLEVSEGGRVLSTRGVSAQIELMRNVFVATRSLQRGTMVSPNDFEPRRMPSSRAPRDAVTDMQLLDDAHLVQAIRVGQPLRAQQVRARAVIKRGSKVRVVFERGTTKVTVMAIALADASRGQMFRLRNPSSKKIITAQAVGDNEARLSL